MKYKSCLAAIFSTVILWGIAPHLYELSDTLPAIAQNTATTPFKTFVEKNTYSIAYPQDWFVTKASRELAHITNSRMPKTGSGNFPDDLIKTDVQINDSNFQTMLNNLLSNEFKEPGEKLSKRQDVTVDGKKAVRLWFTGGQTESVVTLVPYKQKQTVAIATFYTANNSKMLPTIEKIHSSFKSLN